MKSIDRIIELEEELSYIKWDILGICETRLSEEKCTTLQSGHILYQNNSEIDTHIEGVAILINKRIKHKIIKIKSISSRVSTSEDIEIEQLYDDISLAKRKENLTL